MRNVPESDMHVLREEAARRGMSINNILLELIKERVEHYLRVKTKKEAA